MNRPLTQAEVEREAMFSGVDRETLRALFDVALKDTTVRHWLHAWHNVRRVSMVGALVRLAIDLAREKEISLEHARACSLELEASRPLVVAAEEAVRAFREEHDLCEHGYESGCCHRCSAAGPRV